MRQAKQKREEEGLSGGGFGSGVWWALNTLLRAILQMNLASPELIPQIGRSHPMHLFGRDLL